MLGALAILLAHFSCARDCPAAARNQNDAAEQEGSSLSGDRAEASGLRHVRERNEVRANVIEPFEREVGRDEDWASGMESQLRDQFDEYLARRDYDVSLRSMECRIRRCRIELLYEDSEQSVVVSDALFSHSVFHPDLCTIASLGFASRDGVQTIYIDCSEGAVRVRAIPMEGPE